MVWYMGPGLTDTKCSELAKEGRGDIGYAFTFRMMKPRHKELK